MKVVNSHGRWTLNSHTDVSIEQAQQCSLRAETWSGLVDVSKDDSETLKGMGIVRR